MDSRDSTSLSTYFKNIAEGITTTLTGMRLTFRHLLNARKQFLPGDVRNKDYFRNPDGRVTIQYPLEAIPIPDHGRYRLHNEMDDCIVCDKCAKVCPVDCIDIEPIKAVEEVGKASDGSPIRLYAARFDIDMAKCCYCGLCTTVCPTECLTMTKTFDYSELDVRDMIYHYANLSPAEAQEKQQLLEQFQKEKEAQKIAAKTVPSESGPAPAGKPATPRPVFKPTARPKSIEESQSKEVPDSKPAPAFRPGMKPAPKAESDAENGQEAEKKPMAPEAVPSEQPTSPEVPASKVPFRPTMRPKQENAVPPSDKASESAPEIPTEKAPKPAFRPTMKPKEGNEAPKEVQMEGKEAEVKPRPAFKPTMKPKVEDSEKMKTEPLADSEEVKPKPAFKPTMKPKNVTEEGPSAAGEELPKPKPAFRPTMKPKPREEGE